MTALRYEDNIGLVHLQAKYGYRWAQSQGSGLSYEDMFQTASIAFCIAAKGFRPETGLKFSSYYTQVALSEFRKEIGSMTGVKTLSPNMRAAIAERKEENSRRRANAQPELPAMSFGVVPISFTDMTRQVEKDTSITFESSIASTSMTPEEAMEAKQEWEQISCTLSPLARLIVDWLRDPPEQLLFEVEARKAHADECKAKGKRAVGLRHGITVDAVANFLLALGDVTLGEVTMAVTELMNTAQRMESNT